MAVQTVESVVNELMSAIEEGYTHSALTRAFSQLAVIVEDQDYRLAELEQHAVEQVGAIESLGENQAKTARKVKKLRVLAAWTDEKAESALYGVGRMAQGSLRLVAAQEIQNHGITALCATLDTHREEYLRRINGLALAGQIMLKSLEEIAAKHNALIEKYNALAGVYNEMYELLADEQEPITEE